MSNQLQITGGAKVRNLEGVLTGTAGVVASVPLGGANGVATLDSSGKVPLSQLPASVITYLGTWNASTNTPTLTNGVGDVGDLYICNVAGTVNFGAGPITFAVGDWVIYSGTTWEKSGGASGTVTSVAMTTPTGLSVTGSPITTSGTLALSLSSGYTIPTTSFLSGLVPYSGATSNVNLGSYNLTTNSLTVSNESYFDNALAIKKTGYTLPFTLANKVYVYAPSSGTGLTILDGASAYSSTFTFSPSADRTYALPNASGTIALTSDIPSLTGYVPYTGATANVNLGTNNLTTTGSITAGDVNSGFLIAETAAAGAGYLFLKGNGTFGALSVYNSIFADGYKYGFDAQGGTSGSAKRAYLDFGSLTNNTTRTYTFPDASGTLALTSDIPTSSTYVDLTSAQTITGIKTFTNEQLFGNGMTLTGGYITYTSGSFNLTLNTNILTANRNVFIKDGSGTLAFTSDIPSLSGYVPYTGATTNVDLGTHTLSAANLVVNHTSGSGVAASITKGGSGEALTVVKSSGSGNAASITGGVTLLSELNLTTDLADAYIASATTWNAKQDALTNPVTGTGTTNYHAKFTGTSTIGNSMLTDDGTTLQSIGATRSNLYLKAASSSYYSQLAFTNGSNGSFGGISYNNSGQYMQFETNSSEWMRLSNDGKLGIGSTIPSGKLEVNIGSSAAYFTRTAGDNGAINPAFAILTSSSSARIYSYGNALEIFTATVGGSATEKARFTSTGRLGIGLTSGTGKVFIKQESAFLYEGLNVYASTNDAFVGIGHTGSLAVLNSSYNSTAAYYPLAFYTSDTERMRITSAGKLCVGRTATIFANARHTIDGNASSGGEPVLEVYNSNLSDAAPAIACIKNSATTNNSARFMQFYSDGGNIAMGGIVGNGSTNVQLASISDVREKENIVSIYGSLDKVLALNPVEFDWIKTGEHIKAGFVAQEVEEIFPEYVVENMSNEGEEERKGLTGGMSSGIIAHLVKAIQELSAKVSALENKS